MLEPRERNGAATWAAEVCARDDVLFLDTETTGLGSTAEIVEIAIVDVAGRILLDTLVRPSRAIPPQVTAIHGITDAMAASQPSWCDVFPLLNDLLREASRVVIYNAEFDRRMLEQSCRGAGLPSPRFACDCAMKQFATFRRVMHPSLGTYRWFSLTDAARYLQVSGRHPFQDAHRALADAHTCRLVVQAMAGASP